MRQARKRCKGGSWLPLGLVLMLAGLLASGCQTYQPVPLDLAAHEAEWRDRRPPGISPRARVLDIPDVMLDYQGALKAALVLNPGLRLARAEAGVAAVSAAEAGRLADPTLELGIARLLNGAASPWTLGAGVGFSIPLSGRLRAAKEAASAAASVALADALVAEHELQVEFGVAWREMVSVSESVGKFSATLKQFEAAHQLVKRQVDAGTLDGAELTGVEVATAKLAAEKATVEARMSAAISRVLRMIGLHPSVEVGIELKEVEGLVGELDVRLAEGHPRLVLARAKYTQAEAELKLEIERQYPDLSLTPGLEWDQGEPKVGGGVSIPLPLLNANRGPIAEARARRTSARIAVETLVEKLKGEAHELHRLRMASQARIHAIEKALIPALERQYEQLSELIELGRGSPLALLESIRGMQEAQLELQEAKLEFALLEFRLGALSGETVAHVSIEAEADPRTNSESEGDE